MSHNAKPIPVPDLDSQPFWDGCKVHELRVQHCAKCRTPRWPPQAMCPVCHSWDSEWIAVSGQGTIYSYVVVHHVTIAAFAEEAPYTIAYVTLDGTDGRVRITSNIVDCAWEQVTVGMPVEVLFEDRTAEITVPLFRPV